MAAPAKKKRPGRWKAGESGNPKGRPAGTGKVAEMRAAIAAHVPELLKALVVKALEGDVGAARLLLEFARQFVRDNDGQLPASRAYLTVRE